MIVNISERQVDAIEEALEVIDALHSAYKSLHRERNAALNERDAAYAAMRDAFRCDECDQWATKMFHNGDQCCDLHATGDGWIDTGHAAAIRAAMAVTP